MGANLEPHPSPAFLVVSRKQAAMPKTAKSNTSQPISASPKDYEALLKQVTDRVWALWQEDLRRSRERGGKILRR
jgi:hypothetical protein